MTQFIVSQVGKSIFCRFISAFVLCFVARPDQIRPTISSITAYDMVWCFRRNFARYVFWLWRFFKTLCIFECTGLGCRWGGCSGDGCSQQSITSYQNCAVVQFRFVSLFSFISQRCINVLLNCFYCNWVHNLTRTLHSMCIWALYKFTSTLHFTCITWL